MTGVRISALRLLCPDPAATAAFFGIAFRCTPGAPAGGGPVLHLGEQRLEFVASGEAASPAPSNATAFQHFAIVVSDMGQAMAHLRTVAGWTPISAARPERLPAASGGAAAFKFRDPDAHPLEFLEFPAGAVPARWRNPGASLFSGIDHTAITVADTDRSIAAYAALGFSATNRQINRGPEQARMDGVAGAVVEVTTLVSSGGGPPHLELLCYREPGTIEAHVSSRSQLATRICLSGNGPAPGSSGSDPDGHRWMVEAPA